MKDSYKTYDFFTGNISPILLFEMEYHSLFYVVENHKKDRFYPEVNPASQVASIGLLAYFEAFCKHQFAAIINLFPSLIHGFSQKRDEPKVDFSTIVTFSGEFEKKIGFVLAEIYDFGTAKSINGLFRDLLGITPFSKAEEKKFSEIVFKRNLLVHHAGYFTWQYFKKNVNSSTPNNQVFKETIKIDTEDYHIISDFLFEMAIKITKETVKAIKRTPEFKVLKKDDVKIKAVEELLQGIYDSIDDHDLS